ncbi:LytTR family DNA-binding domain-containing protein [Paenibacillus hexagrammi]|uniref:LytTR family transcriptional regulator DNA-binding domain-containing protein n=1 Tax=Paenibacillus hexagrammi TaxID=2908839 RepID=A0ABY3SSQ4_9BACL|nr:LytTR family DNA-binding domain-containing protein [Paenibacillus sp. YPD9-1]UJF36605.1 LytTR family transcriptional regulator DNA-binding domain-containing protein [Paenibacillus sp. YPD9-1]
MEHMMVGVNVELVAGQIEYRTFNILNDVKYMEITPKPKIPGFKPKIPPNIPLFHTVYGSYLVLHSLESWEKMLRDRGFELSTPSYLVNLRMVDEIKQDVYGYSLCFSDGTVVPVSMNKVKKIQRIIEEKVDL